MRTISDTFYNMQFNVSPCDTSRFRRVYIIGLAFSEIYIYIAYDFQGDN